MEMEMEMEAFGMSPTGSAISSAAACGDEGELRRGPWTVEEDMLLVDYVAKHGEGRWNSLARCAGLKRTGKSCRLRWLNYLRPDVRRGNITPEEQLLILELHSRWGNRWSKIAQHLPGRTDNEIKNYWRTRVQKHAKQLKCDVNSKQFRDVMRYIWMPRLVERMQADAAAAAAGDMTASVPVTGTVMSSPGAHLGAYQGAVPNKVNHYTSSSEPNPTVTMSPDTSSTLRSSLTEASHGAHFTSGTTPGNEGAAVFQCGGESGSTDDDVIHSDVFGGSWSELLATTGLPEFEFGDLDDSMWSLEDNCLQQQYYC